MKEETNQKVYRYYMAEGAKALTNNVASMAGGSEMTVSLRELEEKIYDATNKHVDEKTADDVINHMKAKLNALGSEV